MTSLANINLIEHTMWYRKLQKTAFALLVLLLGVTFSNLQAQSGSIGGPYTVDEHTMLLLHFDGDTVNETDRSANARTHGNIQFIQDGVNDALGGVAYFKNDAVSDSSYMTIPDDDNLDLPGSFTVELWFQVLTYGTTAEDHRFFPSLLWKRGGTDDHWSQGNYFVEVKGDTRYLSTGYFAPDSGTYPSIQSKNNLIEPGKWYHATLIRDTSNTAIVQLVHNTNGELIYHESTTYNPESEQPNITNTPLFLGSNGNELGDQPGWFDGFMDEVRISNTVRSFAVPPVVKDVAITEDTWTVDAEVAKVGSSDISDVKLRYKVGAQGTFEEVSMSSSGEGMYTGTIPEPDQGIVYYYVKAENAAGQTSTFPSAAEDEDAPQYLSFAKKQENTQTLFLDFESGSGEPLDQSAYGTDINTGGAPLYTENAAAGDFAIDLNGESDYLEVNSPLIGDTNEFGFDFWLNSDSLYVGEGRGHWQFIVNKPALEPGLWGENSFEIIAGAFDNDNRQLTAGIYVEHENGSRESIRMMLDSSIVNHQWYHLVFEVRAAPAGDPNDYYAFFQLRDSEDNVINTVYSGFTGDIMKTNHPMRIGKAVGDWPSHFDGKIDNFSYYNYPGEEVTVEAPPTIGEVTDFTGSSVSAGSELEVKAYAVSGLGSDITSATLHYKTGASWQTASMTLDDTMYVANIPALEEYGVAQYYVTVENATGLRAVYPEAAEADNPYYLMATAGEPNTKLIDFGFEGGSGVPADQSSYATEARAHGDMTYTGEAAAGSNALDLDGETNYLEFMNPLIATSEEFSFDFWMNGDDFSGFWSFIANKPAIQPPFWGENTVEVLYGAFDETDPMITAGVWNETEGSIRVTVDEVLETDAWYHVLFEVRAAPDTSESNYYAVLQVRDGQDTEIGTEYAEFNHSPSFSFYPFRLGKAGGDRPYFDGQVDNVSFYNYAHHDLTITSIEDGELASEMPRTYSLDQNYPNPFNPTTKINYSVPNAGPVKLTVYNILGREVGTLVNTVKQPGNYTVEFDATNLSSGIYLYRLEAGSDFVTTRKMMLIK